MINDVLTKELLNKFLVFSNTDNASSGDVPENYSSVERDAICAIPINTKHIKTVVQVPSGTRALYESGDRNGTISGMYKSDGGAFAYNISSSNWYTWVNGDGFIFVILQNVLHGDSSNDVIRAKSVLTNTSGKIFTTEEGIVACCIGMTPSDDIYNSYRKHITFEPVDRAYESLQNSYTSADNKATAICGAGNKRKYGSCCLYYSTQHHDKIRGVTYAAGDFYRCADTECYRCADMAESLGMQYRFNRWSSGTGITGGTGESCLHCDSEDFPSNCGPCECTIDWNERIYHYDSILSTNDFSPHTSVYKNAQIAKANDEQGGAITSIIADINKFTLEERTIPSSYRNTEMLMQLTGDFDEDSHPIVHMVTEVDNDGKLIWIGTTVVDAGSNASIAEINYDELIATFLPNVSKGKLQEYTRVNVSPLRGFHLSLDQLYSVRTMLDIQVPKNSISAVSDAVSINSVSICSGGGIDGGNIFAGNANNEATVARLTSKLVIENTEAEEAPPKTSVSLHGGVLVEDESSFTEKTGKVVASLPITASGTVDAEVTGKQTLYRTNKILTIDSVEWAINSFEPPTNPVTGDKIDTRNIIVEHTHPFKTQVDLGRGTPANLPEMNIQIYL